jgi:putative ABC transport system permease protein
MGSVLFRLLVAIALRAGLNPNDLKLITAIFVFVALILPNILGSLRRARVEGTRLYEIRNSKSEIRNKSENGKLE